MSRRFGTLLAVLCLCQAVVIAWAVAGPVAQTVAADKKDKAATTADGDKKPAEAAGKELFGLTKVWKFDLTLTAKEWEGLQPAGGGFPGFPGGPGVPGGPPKPAKP